MRLFYNQSDIEKYLCGNRNIAFEVTNNCNLDCFYCTLGDFYSNRRKRSRKKINVEIVKAFLDFMIEKWNSRMNISYKTDIWLGFYGGEPLLGFDEIKAIVEYSKKKNLKFNNFRYTITTNGILLNEYIDYLEENNFDVLVSLDGNERNNAYRRFQNGKPSYTDLCKVLFEIKEKYQNFFNNSINFNAVLHNLNSVGEILSFFKKEFNKTPGISQLNSNGVLRLRNSDFQKIFKLKKEYYSKNRVDLNCNTELLLDNTRIIEYAKYFHYKLNHFFKTPEHLIFGKHTSNCFPTGSCIPMQKKIFVRTDGDLYPCERVEENNIMGKVSKNGVDIWYQKITDKYNHYFDRLSSQCNTCINKATCSICILNSNIEKNNYKCKFWECIKKYKNNNGDIQNFLEDNREMYQRIAEEIFFV